MAVPDPDPTLGGNPFLADIPQEEGIFDDFLKGIGEKMEVEASRLIEIVQKIAINDGDTTEEEDKDE